MEGEIRLGREAEGCVSGEESWPLGRLEEAIGHLLMRYHEILREKEALALALHMEREREGHLEQRLELLSLDREKVKTRIDQLLLQLRVLDI